jgi:ribonuclease HI
MKIEIYTDGACRGNGATNALGAWAYIVYIDGVKKDTIGRTEKGTTNNKMELTSILQAMQYIQHNNLYERNQITIYSDSQYSINSVTLWANGWKKKNWKGVKNTEIIIPIYELYTQMPNIKFQHVRGHSGNSGNEEVDRLCNLLMDAHQD